MVSFRNYLNESSEDRTDTVDASSFTNAEIGEGTLIEPGVDIGFRYHEECGPALLGKDCMIRRGTVIYGDTRIGDHFQAGYNSVIRAFVKMGDYCTLMNQSTIEGIVRFGTGVRVMSHVYIPSRTWVGDHVFIGPGVTFTNDRFPGRIEPMPTPRGATIEDDVMIRRGRNRDARHYHRQRELRRRWGGSNKGHPTSELRYWRAGEDPAASGRA